jgi:SAM-dependent methyltransferase
MTEHHDESRYGERIAGVYDALYSEYDEAAIETLAELARGGPVLELGIGTGRIALPLKRDKGLAVHGIDASPAMVERLRAKPGGTEIPVTLGDFARLELEGQFALVYVVFNTFFNLLTQEAQVDCFENVAAHLQPEGVFVIEAFVPDPTRFSGQQTVRAIHVDADQVRLEAGQHDPVNQRVRSQQIHLNGEGVRLFPVQLRYAWPSELDLMARLAGLVLQHRWGDWARGDFTAQSGHHVSVYGRS